MVVLHGKDECEGHYARVKQLHLKLAEVLQVSCSVPHPPPPLMCRLEWNRLKRVYLQLQKQEMSRAKRLLAEYKSTPQPPPAAKTSVTKGGGMYKCFMSDRSCTTMQSTMCVHLYPLAYHL